jgi:hypothetical protein
MLTIGTTCLSRGSRAFPLDPVIRLVPTSQKPSSSWRRDIVSVEELGWINYNEGFSEYTSVENVLGRRNLSDAVGGVDVIITEAVKRPLSDVVGGVDAIIRARTTSSENLEPGKG